MHRIAGDDCDGLDCLWNSKSQAAGKRLLVDVRVVQSSGAEQFAVFIEYVPAVCIVIPALITMLKRHVDPKTVVTAGCLYFYRDNGGIIGESRVPGSNKGQQQY